MGSQISNFDRLVQRVHSLTQQIKDNLANQDWSEVDRLLVERYLVIQDLCIGYGKGADKEELITLLTEVVAENANFIQLVYLGKSHIEKVLRNISDLHSYISS